MNRSIVSASVAVLAVLACGVSSAFTGEEILEIEPLSEAPSIDADMDAVWDEVPWNRLSNQWDANEFSDGVIDFKAGWHGDTLYFWFEAHVDEVVEDGDAPWDNDSVEIYIDASNEGGSYGEDSLDNFEAAGGPAQLRVNTEPAGDAEDTYHFAGFESVPGNGWGEAATNVTEDSDTHNHLIYFEFSLTLPDLNAGDAPVDGPFGFAIQYNDPGDEMSWAYWAGGPMLDPGEYTTVGEGMTPLWQDGDSFAGAELVAEEPEAQYALRFDGESEDRIDIGAETGELSGITLEFWGRIEPDAAESWPRILGVNEGGADWEYNQDGLFGKPRWDGDDVESADNWVVFDEWAHYTITYDLEAFRFYRDGELHDEQSLSGSAASHLLDAIGNRHDGERTFHGLMADVRIWDHARSEGAIQGDMGRRLSGGESGLIAYWPLSEGSGTTANDLSASGINGTIVGAEWVQVDDLPIDPEPAPVPYVLDFSGDDDSFVESGLTPSDLGLDGNAPRTIEAWAYTRDFNNGGVFSMGTRSDGQDFSHRTMTSTNDWRVQFWGGAYDFDFNYPTENEWVHFALVHTGDESFLYANGEVVGSGDQQINTGNNFTFRAGSWHDTDFFNGMIADLRVWDHARSASVINRDMNQRLRGSETGLILYWPMNEGDGDPNDLTANNLHGAIEGNVSWVQAPDLPVADLPDAPPMPDELTRAAALDFVDGYVEANDGIDAGDLGISGNAPRTIEAWAYTRGFNDGGIFSLGVTGADGQDFSLRTLGGADEWRTQLWGGADVDFDYPSENQWVHFAVVHTGSETIVFANGELIVSQEQEINTSTTEPFRAGTWHHWDWDLAPFDGLIADVRVWDYSRPQSAIMADMYQRLTGNEDGLVLYWPMDENDGETVFDLTPNEFHGTIVGDVSWASEEMPDVDGLHWEEAASILEEAGFRLHIEYVRLGVVPTGHVHAQAPVAGQTSAPYWTVVLQVESEPQSFAPAAPACLMLVVMVSLLSLAGLRMRKGVWVS